MKKIIDFLSELQCNNNRPWFEAHKDEYKAALQEFNEFALQLIDRVALFDPTVRGLTLKDTTYRIYRDVRFSPNKDPYKTHMGVYICRGGKKSGYAGYYFHIEPEGDGLLAGNLMTSGIYMPEPKVLKSVRDEIFANGNEMLKAVKECKGFKLEMSNSLKKTPAGYPAESPFEEYLRLKDFYVTMSMDDSFLLRSDLVQEVADRFKTTHKLINILNRAVDYAYEMM